MKDTIIGYIKAASHEVWNTFLHEVFFAHIATCVLETGNNRVFKANLVGNIDKRISDDDMHEYTFRKVFFREANIVRISFFVGNIRVSTHRDDLSINQFDIFETTWKVDLFKNDKTPTVHFNEYWDIRKN